MSLRLPLAAWLAAACLLFASCSSSSKGKQATPNTSVAATASSSIAQTTAEPVSSTSPPTTQAVACGSGGVAGGGSGKDPAPPGDIPDNQAYIGYQSTSGGYRTEVPEGWARSDGAGLVSFTDKLNTIRIEVVAAASPPTVASARQADAQTARAASRCFALKDVSQVSRKAGSAVLITYQADAPPDPVTGKIVRDDVERYEFWRAGREAIITLSSPAGSDNVDPWRRVTDSFSWTT